MTEFQVGNHVCIPSAPEPPPMFKWMKDGYIVGFYDTQWERWAAVSEDPSATFGAWVPIRDLELIPSDPHTLPHKE